MTASVPTESLDVLIVGAGISGLGAARYVRTLQPGKTFAVLEARESLGGTWDLFRYPGIRSDSDLQTFGYEFKPWRDRESIASAPRILSYLREMVDENQLDSHIRYRHKVIRAEWSSEQSRWLVEVERADTGDCVSLSVGWLFCASGYYDYDCGYSPEFAGADRFGGRIVHPQHWPQDLAYAKKRVVVIGSGATAVTLIPAMAKTAGHVTMLQRTPTYILPVPREDVLANLMLRVFGPNAGYALARRKNIARQRLVWLACKKFPRTMRRVLRRSNARLLPPGYPVDTHFNPPYNPWDQRLCLVPDGDLFHAINEGSASVVTDRIDTFTETGILLASGEHLEADVIVTATGLNLKVAGGIALSVDGNPVDLSEAVAYRGCLLSGVPNFSLAIGYTNAAWTLKIGLLCQYVCRLLDYMDIHGYDTVRPEADTAMSTRPLLDFGAGYVQRSLGELPRQGPMDPWLTSMNYHDDLRLLRTGAMADDSLRFSRTT